MAFLVLCLLLTAGLASRVRPGVDLNLDSDTFPGSFHKEPSSAVEVTDITGAAGGAEGAIAELHSEKVTQAHSDTDTDAAELDEDSAYCWRTKEFFRKEKTYHFELDNNKQSTAIALVRSKSNPRLIIHTGKEWEVSIDTTTKTLHWKLSAFENSSKSEDVSIFDDVAYIKRTADPDDDELVIVLANGERESIKGGVYYPEEVMKAGLEQYDENATFATEVDVILNSTTTKDVANAEFKKGSRIGRFTGGVVGGAAGTVLGSAFGAVGGIASLKAALSLGIITIGNSAPMGVGFALAIGAGGIGLVVGALIVLPLGIGLGSLAGNNIGATPNAYKAWMKARKEMGLSASDKLFTELQCLRGMKRCSDGDTLVPNGKECPQ